MPDGRTLADLRPEVVEELREIALRVSYGPPAFRVLQNILNEDEWGQIEEELQEYYPSTESIEAGKKPKKLPHEYALQTLVRLRNISQARSVIELALANDLLTGASYRRLLREIGEQEETPPAAPVPPAAVAPPEPPRHPEWDDELCELWYGGQLLKRIRGRKVAKNVIKVLDAFQEEGWPRHILDPLPKGADSKRLHDTISSLNEGLELIHFRADGNGEGFCWEMAPSP